LIRELRRWGGSPVPFYDYLISSGKDIIFPEFEDIIFCSVQDVSHFYNLSEGKPLHPEATVLSLSEAIDATVKCLFRRGSVIASQADSISAVNSLRMHFLEQGF